MDKTFARIVRMIAIVLMGLTAAITLVSGIGTVCVAWRAENWESMAALVPYKPLYQVIVVITIAVAVAAIAATVGLARTKRWGYLTALISLLVGLAVASVHVYFSGMLRGSTMPAALRLYLSILTLALILLLRLPGIWSHIAPGKQPGGPGSWATPAAITLLLAGPVVMTTPLWVRTSHTLDGFNWATVLVIPLLAGGGALIVAGIALLAPLPQVQDLPPLKTQRRSG